MKNLVTLDNVSIHLPVLGYSNKRLINALISRFLPHFQENDFEKIPKQTNHVIALKDFSINLHEGQRVALIGPNGSGKSTLLRTIAGIFDPVVGTVSTRGVIGTLIDNQTFLNFQATGYENFQIAVGFSRHIRTSDDIEKANKKVQSFADLGKFYFMPLSSYSNGMLSRLGLALALIEKPDILLVDENFGAGDEKFQNRISKSLDDYLDDVGVLIMASHSQDLLKRFCSQGLVVNNGNIEFFGEIEDALAFFGKM